MKRIVATIILILIVWLAALASRGAPAVGGNWNSGPASSTPIAVNWSE